LLLRAREAAPHMADEVHRMSHVFVVNLFHLAERVCEQRSGVEQILICSLQRASRFRRESGAAKSP